MKNLEEQLREVAESAIDTIHTSVDFFPKSLINEHFPVTVVRTVEIDGMTFVLEANYSLKRVVS